MKFDMHCIGCGKKPSEIDEYVDYGADADMTPDEYVRCEEGTYNRSNGHFMCTACYLIAGCPSSEEGYVAP